MDTSAIDGQPLAGLTVLITRAREQAPKLASAFEALGASAICVSTIEFIPPASWEPVDRAIDKLEGYSWVIFTSANAVRFFLKRLRERLTSAVEAINGTNIVAIGPATARALEAGRVKVDMISPEASGEGTLDALIERAGGRQHIAALRFLLPRSEIGRDFLPDELRKLGAQVDCVEVYRTVRPDADAASLIQLLTRGGIDIATFTSPSSVKNFSEIVNEPDLSALMKGVLIACIGPVTAEAARGRGLADIIEPREYTTEALVEAVVAAVRMKM